VRLPLEQFEALRRRSDEPRPAPAPVGATLGATSVDVRVRTGDGASAWAVVELQVTLLREGWIQVPLLPVGTAVVAASANGEAIELTPLAGWLTWTVRGEGARRLRLEYALSLTLDETGGAAGLPLPPAPAHRLSVHLPDARALASVVPATTQSTSPEGEGSLLKATLPGVAGAQLVWSRPAPTGALVTSATYSGVVRDDVVRWEASLQVVARRGGADGLTLPVLGGVVALATATVGGRPAVVREQGERLVAELPGPGRHELRLRFETPVRADEGPPGTQLWLPRPPMAAFSLDLPGAQELTVQPAAGVRLRQERGRTVASFQLTPTENLRLRWSPAVPDAASEELRATAELYHVAAAQEGVLQVKAHLALAVSRGGAHLLRARIPAGVVVTEVLGEGVVDWRVAPGEPGSTLTVFFDRELSGEHRLAVRYERLVDTTTSTPSALAVPLLHLQDVQRQRGMLTLLTGNERSIEPSEVTSMTAVGDNQLPAWLRTQLSQPVAHTYKYVAPDAGLTARLVPPKREAARFDATVDTLLSVGEGAVKATATVALTLKTGRLMELELLLPAGVNLVGVTAPSLREHELRPAEDGRQVLGLQLTQELEGSLAVEVSYERVLTGDQRRLAIPTLHVRGADTEQGRLALEALSAVELQAAQVSGLQTLDPQELPRQLMLRTTNPILLAYRYLRATPLPQLELEVRHHAQMPVQVAAIDQARYQTVYTRPGLALTRVVYRLRNRRKQFLQVQLPAGSRVWSAQLAGQPVKPARGSTEGTVLLPLINSPEGFELEFVYASERPALGFAGWLRAELPQPDVVESRCVWDVFLPPELEYGRPGADLALSPSNELPPPDSEDLQTLDGALAASGADSPPPGRAGALPLRIQVPTRGHRLRFEKLLGAVGDDAAGFTLHYSSASARGLGVLLLMLAVAGALGLVGTFVRVLPRQRPAVTVVVALGALLVALAGTLWLGGAWPWALVPGLLGAAGLVARRRMLRRLRLGGPVP